MNITAPILKAVVSGLRAEATNHPADTEEADTFVDAADALDDAIDLLKELGQQ